jgi:putative hemolysin
LDTDPSGIINVVTLQLLQYCLGIAVLFFVSALIASSETALFLLTQKDISEIEHKNRLKAKQISSLLEKPKKLFITHLIVGNLCKIAIVTYFFIFLYKKFDPIFSTIVNVLLLTSLLLLLCEMLPKIYAKKHKIQVATTVVYPIAFFNFILTPINVPLRNFMLFLESKYGKPRSNISVNQLSQVLELTSTNETSDDEQKILEGIVSFGNTEVSQVMSPRIDVFSLDIEEPFEAILPKIIEKEYSRIPVYKDTIDAIVGVLFLKDLIPYIDTPNFEWTTLLREPFFVPENKKLDNLLNEFQKMKNHLAIVVDEYGGTSGIISLEDIIEEIVGDISDEFDDENINFSQIDENNFLFEGKINLKDFYRITNVNEDLFEENKGEAETLAGFILEIFGNFPKKGQKITFDNCLFLIEVVDKKRVKQIKVTLK